MTPLETLEKIARHLAVQNARAFDGTDCQYRTDDGLMCAVGCLISDKHMAVHGRMHGLGAADLPNDILEDFSLGTDALSAIQRYHDCDNTGGCYGQAYQNHIDVGTDEERYVAILSDLKTLAESWGVVL